MGRLKSVIVILIGIALGMCPVAEASLPQEAVRHFAQQTGVSFEKPSEVEPGEPVAVEVVDSKKLTLKIISMDRNFACEKGDKIKVVFTGSTSAMMLLSEIGKVVVFDLKDGKWLPKKLAGLSTWPD